MWITDDRKMTIKVTQTALGLKLGGKAEERRQENHKKMERRLKSMEEQIDTLTKAASSSSGVKERAKKKKKKRKTMTGTAKKRQRKEKEAVRMVEANKIVEALSPLI